MANRMYLPLLPELIDDLVIEILARLPVKLLLQFKCVSKSWCSLIESDAFISTHFRKHQSSDKLVLLRHNLVHPSSEEERGVLSFHDMDSPQLQELWPSLSTYTRFPNQEYGTRLHRLLGPCNGLVLVVDRDDVFVCNPSLRELELLPRCPFSDPRGYYKNLSDNNHDVVDVVTSGWGFGSTNAHDFNVVQLQCCYRIEFDVSKTCSLKAHLYESATSSWKDLGYVDTMFTHIGYRTSELFFNGAFHWHTDLLAQGHPGVILTFDINTGIFGQMEYRPKRAWEYSMSKILLVLNDCLALFWCTAYVDDFHGIWIMKEYGNEESWSPLIAIGPQTIERPLLFWENEVLIENGEGQLASCSLDTNKIERFPIHGVAKTFRAVTYKESLISLKTRQSVN